MRDILGLRVGFLGFGVGCSCLGMHKSCERLKAKSETFGDFFENISSRR